MAAGPLIIAGSAKGNWQQHDCFGIVVDVVTYTTTPHYLYRNRKWASFLLLEIQSHGVKSNTIRAYFGDVGLVTCLKIQVGDAYSFPHSFPFPL
jgi:hypothetical protein